MKKIITFIILINSFFSFSQLVTTISGFQGYGYYDASIGSSSFNDPIITKHLRFLKKNRNYLFMDNYDFF